MSSRVRVGNGSCSLDEDCRLDYNMAWDCERDDSGIYTIKSLNLECTFLMHQEETLEALQPEYKTLLTKRTAAVANPEGMLKCLLPL